MIRMLMLVAIMLAWQLGPQDAMAQSAPACRGKDLMAQMRDDQPLLHAAVIAEASAVPNGEAVLWKIEGGTGARTSWLLGTIHLSDDRIARIEGAKRDVLDRVSTVALEITGVGDGSAIQRELAANPQVVALPAGQTLWDLIDAEFRDVVAERLKGLGLGRAQAARLQPWLPAMMLAKSACQAAREGAGLAVLDAAVEKYAASKGARLVGLETAIEQFEAMSSMPLASQAAFLSDTARMSADIDDFNETMIQQYLKKRIPVLMPFQAAYLGNRAHRNSAEATRDFIQTMIVRRNQKMAKRAKPLLQSGNALIAVGALHLPGKEGLVALFRQQGFTVTPAE